VGFPTRRSLCWPRTKVRRPPGGIAGRLVHRVHALGGRLPGGVTGRLLHCLHSLVCGPPGGGYGWSHTAEPPRRFDAFQVLINVERRPNPANRIVLGTRRDAHGLPRVTLRWRWRDEEQAELARLRTAVAAWLEAADLGRVEIQTGARPDPNAHHHAGTTRMHADPSRGGRGRRWAGARHEQPVRHRRIAVPDRGVCQSGAYDRRVGTAVGRSLESAGAKCGWKYPRTNDERFSRLTATR